MRYSILIATTALSLTACSGAADEAEEVSQSCGIPGTGRASECTGLNSCGAGAGNFRAVTFCSLCPRRPETHVCEAGMCKPLGEGGSVLVRFNVPDALASAGAFTLTSFGPIAADGTKLTCAALLSTCKLVDNEALPVGNSNHLRFSSGPADPALVYTANLFDYAGQGRLLLLQVTSEAQGNGAVLGHGCVEGLDVQAGASIEAQVEVRPI